jgi:hypothetical protein
MRFGSGAEPREVVEVIAFFDTLESTEFWRRVEPA